MLPALMNKVYLLSEELDEKVVKLPLLALSSMPTVLTQEHAHYVCVKVEGPCKSGHYSF